MKEIKRILTNLEQNPLGIMEIARLSCVQEKPLDQDDIKLVGEKASLLQNVDKELLREKLQIILTEPKAGRGLRFCLETGALQYILGEECIREASKREFEAFVTYSYNIEKVIKELDYREALLFMCFEKKRAKVALEYLKYDEQSKEIYSTNSEMLEDMAFIGSKLEFKRFVYKYGLEYYNYLNTLSKQQRKVYDLNEYRILSRKYLLEEIRNYKEVLFEEDLAVSEDDLVAAGIVNREKAPLMRSMLVDIAHKLPRVNTKEQLLKKAKILAKRPLAAKMRKIRWIK